MGKAVGRPSKGMVMSKHNIELAIRSLTDADGLKLSSLAIISG